MAPCRRRYSARRFKALGHDPQLLVIRPAPPATSLDHLKSFKLSTALIAVHKDCYAPVGLIQQGGPRRRETLRTPTGPFLVRFFIDIILDVFAEFAFMVIDDDLGRSAADGVQRAGFE